MNIILGWNNDIPHLTLHDALRIYFIDFELHILLPAVAMNMAIVSVQHLLLFGTSVFEDRLQGPVTLTYLFLSVWQWSCHYLFNV